MVNKLKYISCKLNFIDLAKKQRKKKKFVFHYAFVHIGPFMRIYESSLEKNKLYQVFLSFFFSAYCSMLINGIFDVFMQMHIFSCGSRGL